MHPLAKGFLYLALFSLLHYGYELTGLSFLRPICGVNESVFEHLKMGFFAYGFLSCIEYFLAKERERGQSFFFSRLTSNLFIPWILFLLWYTGQAIWGKNNSWIGELAWAFTVTVLAGTFGSIMEHEVAKKSFPSATRLVFLFLWGASLFLFVRFTYHPPAIDLFALP